MNRTHHYICTSGGSTSWYLSKGTGEDIKILIENHGLEFAKKSYLNNASRIHTVWFNHGMGEIVELERVYNSEDESHIEDVVAVLQAAGCTQADVHYTTDTDIEFERLSRLDEELKDITEAIDKAVITYLKANVETESLRKVMEDVLQAEVKKRDVVLNAEKWNYLRSERFYGGDFRESMEGD